MITCSSASWIKTEIRSPSLNRAWGRDSEEWSNRGAGKVSETCLCVDGWSEIIRLPGKEKEDHGVDSIPVDISWTKESNVGSK
jgi:hypothetical protein